MAQYGHNWYGTSYYGETNAFSGWYQTKEIFTDEPLKSTVNINIKATLPSATYGPTAAEVDKIAGTWTYDAGLGKLYSSSTNAQLYMQASCDEITIKYEQRTTAAKVNIQITTVQPGKTDVVTNYVLNTQAGTVNANATYKITGLAFGKQQIRITMAVDSPAGANFNFKGFTARTANLVVESRARVNYDPNVPMLDSDYTKLTTTITPISGNDYTISAVTPNYVGKKYIQLKIYLASSDNETTPEVQWIELVAGDSNNRTTEGQWTGVFNMVQIATLAGVSFSKVEEVTWTENVPKTTSLTMRSASVVNNTAGEWNLAKITVPYKLNTNRIRLKEGRNGGWIDAPLLAPASKIPYTSTVEWHEWNDQSFVPPDSGGVAIKYDFLSTQKDNTFNPYRTINPMEPQSRSLRGSKRLSNFDANLRITLSRPSGKQTPVVDFISLSSFMHYKQDAEIENQDFSAVDFNNTGKGIVLDMNVDSFKNQFKTPAFPSAPEFIAKYNLTSSTTPIYLLMDETGRPQDLTLYYDSEASLPIRNNLTTTLSDKVWVQSKPYSSKTKTGLQKGFQYGGGEVKFPEVDEIQMSSTFTMESGIPMSNSLRYHYYLMMGWPQQYHTSVAGDTLESIASRYSKDLQELEAINSKIRYNNDNTLMETQSIKLPNDTMNSSTNIYWKSTNGPLTSKSSGNSVLDKNPTTESDSIIAEVSQTSTYGWVTWQSEEKKYDGVVNLNDISKGYSRTHPSSDYGNTAQVNYVVLAGDTYKSIATQFDVYEEDIRRLNKVTEPDAEPVTGKIVVIPSKISLPSIHPKAIVSDNPYKITMVYNSVKKKDGKILPLTAIKSTQPVVTYQTVTVTDIPVTRGKVANGQDLLPHARVKQILSAKSEDGMTIYNPWVSDQNPGNFKRVGNYIDWSSNQIEPAKDSLYYVTYKVEVPKDVTVDFSADYYEEGGVDRIWRSTEVKEFKGMCYPGKDYVANLPAFNEWEGLPNNKIEDIAYVIEDNDIWVKTWAEKRHDEWVVVGSLQDRVPKDNWFPTIKTGYYYLGKDEYYLFNEPIVVEPGERDIPIASNVDFVEGKFENAAQMQEGSTNIIRNSGLESLSPDKTVYKLTF